MLNEFNFNKMPNTKKENNFIDPIWETPDVNGPNQNKKNDHKQDIQKLGRVDAPFNLNRSLMKTGLEMMLLRVFFDADPGPHIKKHNQGFGEQINNARQHHEGQVIGFENIKVEKTLKEGYIKQEKR